MSEQQQTSVKNAPLYASPVIGKAVKFVIAAPTPGGSTFVEITFKVSPKEKAKIAVPKGTYNLREGGDPRVPGDWVHTPDAHGLAAGEFEDIGGMEVHYSRSLTDKTAPVVIDALKRSGFTGLDFEALSNHFAGGGQTPFQGFGSTEVKLVLNVETTKGGGSEAKLDKQGRFRPEQVVQYVNDLSGGGRPARVAATGTALSTAASLLSRAAGGAGAAADTSASRNPEGETAPPAVGGDDIPF